MAESVSSFVKKLQKSMGKERPREEKSVYFGEYDENILLTSVTEEELKAAQEYSKDPEEQNKYLAYMGSPTLREAAGELVKLEAITEPLEIMNSFKTLDVAKMAETVVELFNDYMKPSITEIKDLKK